MNKILKFNTSASRFEESMLLGNGFLGAAVYGGTNTERYSMNESTLWSGYPTYCSNPNGKEVLKNARSLIEKGEYLKAAEEIEQGFTGTFSQTYLPLCSIYIENKVAEPTEYSRTLDMETGISLVNYKSGDICVKRESFINNPNNVMAIKITQQNVELTKIYIKSELQCSISSAEDRLILRGTAPSFDHPIGRRYSLSEKRPTYAENDNEKGMRYKAILWAEANGELRFNGDCIEVLNSSEITIYFAAKTSFNGFNKHPYLDGAEVENACNKLIENAISKGYDELRKEHIQDFSNLFNRTDFSLCNSKTELNTDEVLKNHNDNALYELLFNMGKYLTISGSRKGGQAMNLQGIWNELLVPPWNSNYTININTEMNYLPTMALNLPECFEPYIELVKNISENGKKIAKEWYDVDGSISHHNTDIWCMANPVGCKCKGTHLYSFYNTSLGWLLWGLCEKYRIEKDLNFLKNTLYPLLANCAETYIQLFYEDENGNLFLSPATSPENSFILENGDICALAKHSAINNAICCDTLKSAAEFAKILGDTSAAERYETLSQKVMPYQISSDGRIMEWDAEYTEKETHHRHLSHLYGLHPAREIAPYKAQDLVKAAKKSLDVRGDEGTGWCIAWKANMWARLFDGNRALKLLDNQLNYVDPNATTSIMGGGTYPNMLCAHPPFQIDGNFGATSAIIEMLVQVNGNDVYILPALPEKWKSGEIKGIAISGGAFINIAWENNVPTKVEIYPEKLAKNYTLKFKA